MNKLHGTLNKPILKVWSLITAVDDSKFIILVISVLKY